MIEIKLEGFDDFEQLVMAALQEELRERVGSIRHPETGEFPSVSITPGVDGQFNIHVEGSPELVALVQARLQEEAAEDGELDALPDEALAIFGAPV